MTVGHFRPTGNLCRECGKDTGRAITRSRMCWPCMHQFDVVMRACNAAISKEVRRGRLPRAKTQVCVDCGKQAHDWDHRDYSRPLDVEPVCRGCNIKRGSAKWVRATAPIAQEAA